MFFQSSIEHAHSVEAWLAGEGVLKTAIIAGQAR
jgi:hypothetical protein